jgi:hypothetical protein
MLPVLVLSLPLSVQAGPSEEAVCKALIARAIDAHGGAEILARFRATTWKGTVTVHWGGQGSRCTLSGARQLGDQGVLTIEQETSGQAHRLVRVVNRSKGWQLLQDRVAELDPDTLAEEAERMHDSWLATLVPFIDGPFTLSLAGTIAIGDRQATGVTVSSPGHRNVTLYFDVETGLLAKKITQIRDLLRNGQEVLQETYYGEYDRMAGIMLATVVQVYWDGMPYSEIETTEITPHGTLPDWIFSRPQPPAPGVTPP